MEPTEKMRITFSAQSINSPPLPSLEKEGWLRHKEKWPFFLSKAQREARARQREASRDGVVGSTSELNGRLKATTYLAHHA
jgi:hypothetical protein